MAQSAGFLKDLEAHIATQLRSQRVGYLLGAGSSYLGGAGYPLAFQLWDLIRDNIPDLAKRAAIQARLDGGAHGLEQALDQLDDGGARDTPYRHLVTDALADLFVERTPPLALHGEFLTRLSSRAEPATKIFSLNYDPLIERAAADFSIRLTDGFHGAEHAFFDPAAFEERIGRIRGTHRGRQFDETVRPVHLLKLHGSLGWYECPQRGTRRGAFGSRPPSGSRRLMIPPQRRKAADTMNPPYSHLWSAFRASLAHGNTPLNRLACIGYGFGDEHVNAILEAALARRDFSLLIFSKSLSPMALARWSSKPTVTVVTSEQCSLSGTIGPGHPDLWSFERLAKGV